MLSYSSEGTKGGTSRKDAGPKDSQKDLQNKVLLWDFFFTSERAEIHYENNGTSLFCLFLSMLHSPIYNPKLQSGLLSGIYTSSGPFPFYFLLENNSPHLSPLSCSSDVSFC